MTAPRCQRKLRGARRECGERVSLSTDSLGRVHEHCPKCARTEAGVCRDCEHRVRGAALYCADCRKARQRASEARRKGEPSRQRQQRRNDKERWARIKADPEQYAAYIARRKAWRAANPDTLKRSRRRYALKRTPGYVAGYTRANRDPVRIAQKRAQALARYYEQHPVRPSPTCVECGGAIAWSPPGRPPKRCDACVPPCVAARRRQPRVAVPKHQAAA